MSSFQVPILAQEGSLLKYLDDIKKFPVLSFEEETALANDWCENNNIVAAQKLVTSHLRLVAKIAMTYRGYGLPIADIISEGNIGLMTAVKKFNPALGHRLSTYAMWWIKATIQDYVLKSWSLVKMGTSAVHKKLFFNLRKIKNKIFNANNGKSINNEIEIISKELGVSQSDVKEMNDRFTQHESSLNDYTYGDDKAELIETLIEPEINQEDSAIAQSDYHFKKTKLNSALSLLNERERDILCARRLTEKPLKLEELSKKYGISNERVRQIEDKAFKKVQQSVMAYAI